MTPRNSQNAILFRATTAVLCILIASLTACDNTHTRSGVDTGPGFDGGVGVDAFRPRVEACPSSLNPFDPSAPGSRCSVEGARCGSDGGPCGGALACTCTSGRWQCLVAEPDPACRCGRQPTIGSPCQETGMSCGTCCPRAGEWPALQCVDGRWAPALCPPTLCPDQGCPLDRRAAVGTYCPASGERCGNACCSSPIECDATNHWVALPEADCICEPPDFPCGSGSCTGDQHCVSECGPTDGIVFSCHNAPDGCTGCGCYTDPSVTCEMRDGHVFVRPNGFCG